MHTVFGEKRKTNDERESEAEGENEQTQEWRLLLHIESEFKF